MDINFCSLSPPSFFGSKVLKSGNLDIDYLGKILEYALATLQKLSAPANEGEMKVIHQRLLKELAEMCETKLKNSHVIAMIKGLRFVLEQVQVCFLMPLSLVFVRP